MESKEHTTAGGSLQGKSESEDLTPAAAVALPDLVADDPETVFRAGFLAGCSFGMDQASSDPMRHGDSPDADAAWNEYKANYLSATPEEGKK